MQNKNWWLGTAALALALSVPTMAQAQDGTAAKTDKTTKPKTDKAGANKSGLNKRTKDTLEAIWGTPLTATQETAIAQAAQEKSEATKAIEAAYKQKVAAALGTTVEEYEAKEKAHRAKSKTEKDAKPKADAAN